MILLQLIWSFFQIGLFSIGGGYAALPLIQQQVVDLNHWLNMTEFIDIITISQMTPGPIAINAATFVGIRIAGVSGAVAATLGCILPSCIIVLILAHLYYKYRELSLMKGILSGLRPAVVALIGAAGLSIILQTFWGENPISFHLQDLDYIAIVIFAISLVILRKWKCNPIYVMIGAGIVGMCTYLLL